MNTQVSYCFWNCYFSSLWLASGCNQNLFLLFALVLSRRSHTATDTTKSMLLYRTHWLHQIVKKC